MRMDDERAEEVAQEFLTSWRAELWGLVTDRVKHALIDSAVMHCVRMAEAIDNTIVMRPSDLLDFRDRVIAQLRSGVRTGGHQSLQFDHEE